METAAKPASLHKYPIVCLGASAGGLEACTDVLREVPSNTGMVFVIVSHRADSDSDLLSRLLARVTRMPVIDSEHRMMLKPNHVFLTPPHTEITTDGIVLYLREIVATQGGWPVTISVFLSSLAKTCKGRAVAVILSGMGYDGCSALAAIKDEGGVIFAQSDATHDDMPQSALQTGLVDHVLTATEIGKFLAVMKE